MESYQTGSDTVHKFMYFNLKFDIYIYLYAIIYLTNIK